MKGWIYRCPACESKRFVVTAHVTQDWEIDCNGTFQSVLDACVEITPHPDESDIWNCANCAYSGTGEQFHAESYMQ